MPQYSVVIPVYNSLNSLGDLTDRLTAVFSGLDASFELVYVDDCSPNPKTWPKLLELSAQPNVRAIRLTRNFGQQAATICGLEHALGDWVITMDDDGQHAPEDIPKLIQERNHDVVIGQLQEKKHTLSKRFFSWVKARFDRIILDKPKGLRLSAFRLIRRETVENMLQLVRTPYPFLPAMMFYVTKDIVGVPVGHFDRSEGKTGYTLRSMFRLFKNLLINNSSLLLRYIGNLGITIALFSFVLGIYFIYKKLFFDIETVGWTSVIVSVLFIGGLVLFTLGVLGEYLIRIINTVERRPLYIVREEVGKNA
ncbi:glycosyltransferase family 2 protein [Cryomorphaceae bacterium]|nr:glycosyltransferase family 2 protein [Cryomorphaceae bacterium]